MRLSNRLSAVANMLEGVSSVADIGCDHGKLSIYLARRGFKVIAADMSEKAADKARRAAKRAGVELDVRVGDGFGALEPGEVQACVIAGLGGREILRIILDGGEAARLCRFVLQPMQRQDELRAGLASDGFRILRERIVKDERLFELMLVESGAEQTPPEGWPEGFFELGWHGVVSRDEHMPELINRRKREIEKRLEQARMSSSKAAAASLMKRLEHYLEAEKLYYSYSAEDGLCR